MIRTGVFVLALLAGAPALAQAAATGFPGGASSLHETHGEWVVSCGVVQQRKSCTVSQQLAQQARGGGAQPVMTISLSPSASGAEGGLALPFGLLLAKGASLQLDEGKPHAPVAIRTCMPAGCIAPLNIGADQLASMRKAKQLKINLVAADTGKPVTLTAPLTGFGEALDRAAALQK